MAVRAALWLVPFRFIRPRLVNGGADGGESRRELVERVTWAVAHASRLVPEASCLTQAMAVRRLLKRRGVGCTLKLGVKRDDKGAFCAHAWIEYAGHVVIGGQGGIDQYAPLPAL